MTHQSTTTTVTAPTDTRTALPPCPAWCTIREEHLVETDATNGHSSRHLIGLTLRAGIPEPERYYVEIFQEERVDWAARQLVHESPMISLVCAGTDPGSGHGVISLSTPDDARALSRALQAAVDAVDGHWAPEVTR